jgi:hypothetical protein
MVTKPEVTDEAEPETLAAFPARGMQGRLRIVAEEVGRMLLQRDPLRHGTVSPDTRAAELD